MEVLGLKPGGAKFSFCGCYMLHVLSFVWSFCGSFGTFDPWIALNH